MWNTYWCSSSSLPNMKAIHWRMKVTLTLKKRLTMKRLIWDDNCSPPPDRCPPRYCYFKGWIFFSNPSKNICCGTHWNCIGKMDPVKKNSTFLQGEIRKYLSELFFGNFKEFTTGQSSDSVNQNSPMFSVRVWRISNWNLLILFLPLHTHTKNMLLWNCLAKVIPMSATTFLLYIVYICFQGEIMKKDFP